MKHILARLLCVIGVHAKPEERIYNFQAYWFCSRCAKMVDQPRKREEGMF